MGGAMVAEVSVVHRVADQMWGLAFAGARHGRGASFVGWIGRWARAINDAGRRPRSEM